MNNNTETRKGETTMEITKEQATNFYRDLCGTVYGDPDKTCGGIMGTWCISEHMGITYEEAENYCNAMIKFGITERQNGMIVL